jgi:two-component system, NarL family, response regulator NreC
MTKVLLVDDHTLFREGIRSLLSTESGMEVVGEASDGREAIELAGKLSPDVIVMDLVMPGMNGMQAAQLLHDQHPDIKILILSMYDDDEYVCQIMKAGASGYVLKRAASDDLLRAIREVDNGGSALHPTVAAKLIKDYVRKSRSSDQRDSGSGLTPRESEVLKLIAEGNTNKQIADLLGLGRKTVDAHRTNIMRKLDLHDVTALVKYALKRGIISLES